MVVNTNGARINLEEYYPFGETAFGSYQYKRYRYNGKEKDEHSGLYEYGQRYYAPWLCRFVSVDPIADQYPQLSSYNYAGNKPITAVDIEGLQSSEDSPNSESQGGAQTDSNGNLTGEYIVKDGQGPTQIEKDLLDVHGVKVDWKGTIDDPRNSKYFDHIQGENRYNEFNKAYEKLNMNPGDKIYFDTIKPKVSQTDDFVGPLPRNEGPPEPNYTGQNIRLEGTIKGAGPFLYAWSRFTVKPTSGSGFYESQIQSNFSGSFGLGDIAGSRLTFEINKDVLDSLQTNSLTEIMEYGSSEVTSHWGGWGFIQSGTFEGFSAKGERVWKAETGLGYNLGYSPPQTSTEMTWENKYPSLQDSIRNAQKSIELGNGNLSDFRNFMSKQK